MGRLTALAAILMAAMPARTMAAQYETPVNPPDPAAQLAELIEIYDSVCLRAFPNDGAVARTMEARGATRDGRCRSPHLSCTTIPAGAGISPGGPRASSSPSRRRLTMPAACGR